MVKINKFKEEIVKLYHVDHGYIGEINDLQFHDVKCQIKEGKLDGYYILFDGMELPIHNSGYLPIYPNNLFCQLDRLLDRFVSRK